MVKPWSLGFRAKWSECALSKITAWTKSPFLFDELNRVPLTNPVEHPIRLRSPGQQNSCNGLLKGSSPKGKSEQLERRSKNTRFAQKFTGASARKTWNELYCRTWWKHIKHTCLFLLAQRCFTEMLFLNAYIIPSSRCWCKTRSNHIKTIENLGFAVQRSHHMIYSVSVESVGVVHPWLWKPDWKSCGAPQVAGQKSHVLQISVS